MATSFNKQLQKVFENPKKSVTTILKNKTNAFLENYVSEYYVAKKIAEDCVAASYNWWVGVCNDKEYAIHIDETIKDIDINFSKELKKIGYEIIFVNINKFNQTVSFVYEDEKYELELLVEKLQLKPSPMQKKYKVNGNVNDTIFEWCYKHLDYQQIIYDGAIEFLFLSKYFSYLINIDVVLCKCINNKMTYFVGEIKFKSKNKSNVFMMNVGEKNFYERIVKHTDVQVIAIALVCSKEDRQSTLVELMSLNEFPIFYMQLTSKIFDNLIVRPSNVSDFGRQGGQTHQNSVEFSFEMFERVIDFGEIGKTYKSFVQKLNRILIQHSDLLNGSKGFCLKHIAKFYALLDMESKGLEVRCDDYLNKENITKNILNINGYKVLFKFVENPRAWNVNLMEREFKAAKYNGVDYIFVYQNISNGSNVLLNLNEQLENGNTFYTVDESTSRDAIKVLGYVSFDIFDRYKHCVPAGIPASQKNCYAIRGIPGYTLDMDSKAYSNNQDMYFLQLLGWQINGIDKEPYECRLQEYDKVKGLPFASSYIFY